MAAMDIEMASPIGVAVGYDQGHQFGIPAFQSDIDICQLLQAMSLTKGKFKVPTTETAGYVPYASQSANEHDVSTEDPAYHSDASESSSSKSSSSDRLLFADSPHTTGTLEPSFNLPQSPPACHFLQSILASLAPDSPVLSPSPYPYPVANAFQTTNGAYLDTLLIHRSLFAAFPPAHMGCVNALRAIARAIEIRAWQADRDSDAEAVAALRQEAHIVSSMMLAPGGRAYT